VFVGWASRARTLRPGHCIVLRHLPVASWCSFFTPPNSVATHCALPGRPRERAVGLGHVAMDTNSYSDSDENDELSQSSAKETGAAHADDERDAQPTHAPAAAQRYEHLNLQQRVPSVGGPVGGVERKPTHNVRASLAGPSTGGAGGPVPEFVQRLLAEELKEWTLAQGERPGNDAQQLYHTRCLEILARLACGNSPSNPNKRAAPPPKLPPSKQPRLATSSLQDEAAAAASFFTEAPDSKAADVVHVKIEEGPPEWPEGAYVKVEEAPPAWPEGAYVKEEREEEAFPFNPRGAPNPSPFWKLPVSNTPSTPVYAVVAKPPTSTTKVLAPSRRRRPPSPKVKPTLQAARVVAPGNPQHCCRLSPLALNGRRNANREVLLHSECQSLQPEAAAAPAPQRMFTKWGANGGEEIDADLIMEEDQTNRAAVPDPQESLSLSVPYVLTTVKRFLMPEKHEQLDQILQRYMQKELGKRQVRSSS